VCGARVWASLCWSRPWEPVSMTMRTTMACLVGMNGPDPGIHRGADDRCRDPAPRRGTCPLLRRAPRVGFREELAPQGL